MIDNLVFIEINFKISFYEINFVIVVNNNK